MEKTSRGEGRRKRRLLGTSLVACFVVVVVAVAFGARRADAFLVRKECFLSRPRSTWTATTLSYLEKNHDDAIVAADGVPSSDNNDDGDEAEETTCVETPPVSPRRSRRRRRAPPVAVRNPYNIPSDPDERWDFFYRHLLEHWLEQGHTMVRPGVAVNESLLRNWVAEQRRGYMRLLGIIEGNRTISIDRKIELDRIGFDWGQFGAVSKEQSRREKELLRRLERPSYEASEDDDDDDDEWAGNYARLADFFVARGHSHVPSVDPNLGRWTWSLRRTAPTKLSDRRREALAKVNFYFFEETKPTKPKWTQYLSRLKSFQDQHGHSDVPADRYPRLAEWVAKQRKAYRYYRAGKKSPINEKRIKALNDAGFDWGLHNDPSKEDVESRKA